MFGVLADWRDASRRAESAEKEAEKSGGWEPVRMVAIVVERSSRTMSGAGKQVPTRPNREERGSARGS